MTDIVLRLEHNRKTHFTAFDNEALKTAASTLSAEAFRIWCVLMTTTPGEKFKITRKWIAETIGSSEQSCKKPIKELVQKGFLTVAEDRHANKYWWTVREGTEVQIRTAVTDGTEVQIRTAVENSEKSAEIPTATTVSNEKTVEGTEVQIRTPIRNTIRNTKIGGANAPNTTAKKRKKSPEVFVPPTLDEVITYCAENGIQINAKKWWSHYDGIGWMSGKNKIVNWQSFIGRWAEEDKEKQAAAQVQKPAPGHQKLDELD